MPDALRGYSSTGAASLSAALGDGDAALEYLKGLFDSYLRPNTLYKETGPVIETPLSGAQSIHDMLLQSWGGTIRPFPAVPSAWPDCVFTDLSAEGGFRVSGQRAGGMTKWVRIESLAGEPFAIRTDINDPVAMVAGKRRTLTPGANGHLSATLSRGETVLIYPSGPVPDMRVVPVKVTVPNSFGLNSRTIIKAEQKDTTLPIDTKGPTT